MESGGKDGRKKATIGRKNDTIGVLMIGKARKIEQQVGGNWARNGEKQVVKQIKITENSIKRGNGSEKSTKQNV